MPSPEPIYTAENCSFSHPLSWGISVFWREPIRDESWVPALVEALRPDGIRLKSHRIHTPTTSQFVVSTPPDVSPSMIMQRVKGRLQYLVRDERPKALRRNFALHGFGKVTRETASKYVAEQLGHHQMADEKVQDRLERYQVSDPTVDLSRAQRTSHGLFWYSLHIVLVHQDRWNEIRDEALTAVSGMIRKSCRAKGYLLSEAGILPDHVHILAGCPFEESPRDVALGFLNNLAYAQGMRAGYQFGAFVGTVGEYTFAALKEGDGAQPG